MVRLSVCVEMVYDDDPFEARVRRAGEAGVDAVEFWGWREKDLDAVAAAADEAGVDVAGCVAGGTLTDPDGTDEAVETVRESIRTAADRGIPTLIATSGPDQAGVDDDAQHDAIVDALSRVAPDAEEAGVTIALEPLNRAVDHPDNYLETSDEGFAIVDEVDSPSVGLLYDVYHQQVTEGNVIQTVTGNVDDVAHVHVADVPGRHEPGTGELNYANVFEALDDAGYDGYVGCEFSPTGDPDAAVASVLDLA
ncbi:hydroxypyruvate isomerase family protein [Candidatus Halobonum tyrrellensis]|uniref:Hydroxypyruvate isomerase n=1 Tax=Candidatus Halobonum tyrrellensis G22 TaxID=1324957 RepID=V4HGX0_9EURY|nr:TIM barrel protein [Candidatus Halobonum tyrrellensis]ESP87079.1 hydroxypyruvate isomerase [Candidatus Halobonum tyrrellensis G22]